MPMHMHMHMPCTYHRAATWPGDLIANTTVAKGGEGGPTQGAKMALAACFGEGAAAKGR